MRVFYVTATHEGAGSRLGPDGVIRHRTDLAKFFDRGASTAFAAELHSSWQQVSIEDREESAEEQHTAHRPRRDFVPVPRVGALDE